MEKIDRAKRSLKVFVDFLDAVLSLIYEFGRLPLRIGGVVLAMVFVGGGSYSLYRVLRAVVLQVLSR